MARSIRSSSSSGSSEDSSSSTSDSSGDSSSSASDSSDEVTPSQHAEATVECDIYPSSSHCPTVATFTPYTRVPTGPEWRRLAFGGESIPSGMSEGGWIVETSNPRVFSFANPKVVCEWCRHASTSCRFEPGAVVHRECPDRHDGSLQWYVGECRGCAMWGMPCSIEGLYKAEADSMDAMGVHLVWSKKTEGGDESSETGQGAGSQRAEGLRRRKLPDNMADERASKKGKSSAPR